MSYKVHFAASISNNRLAFLHFKFNLNFNLKFNFNLNFNFTTEDFVTGN